jgi:putative membrane protein
MLCIAMLFVGIIASATMVIPGVSGSLIMMIMGVYFGIIGSINGFIDSLLAFDMKQLINEFLILCPFGIGCILGIFLISKLIEWLFQRYCTATYCAIGGLILASPFAIFYKVQQESSMAGTSVIEIVVAVILLVVCTIVTYKLGQEDAAA